MVPSMMTGLLPLRAEEQPTPGDDSESNYRVAEDVPPTLHN